MAGGKASAVRSAFHDGRVGLLAGSDGNRGAGYGRCRERGASCEVIRRRGRLLEAALGRERFGRRMRETRRGQRQRRGGPVAGRRVADARQRGRVEWGR